MKTWSKDQTPIALSSGEAELYAADKVASEGLGLQSLAADLGMKAEIVVEINASAAMGIKQRRGLGNVRHIEVQELWSPDALKKGRFQIKKVKGVDNTADLMTKPLCRQDIENNLCKMGHRRPSCVVAPR